MFTIFSKIKFYLSRNENCKSFSIRISRRASIGISFFMFRKFEFKIFGMKKIIFVKKISHKPTTIFGRIFGFFANVSRLYHKNIFVSIFNYKCIAMSLLKLFSKINNFIYIFSNFSQMLQAKIPSLDFGNLKPFFGIFPSSNLVPLK